MRRASAVPENDTAPLRPARRAPVWIACALAVATALVNFGGLGGPFVFDDIPSIPEYSTLRSLWPLSGSVSPPGEGLTVSGRPVLNLSFALNVAGGATPRGFRLTNIAIHLGAGLLLLGLARRTLASTPLRARFGSAALPLAGAIAALWLLHPLQTAAVTYIVQRAESLMGFFYLLTLYAFARGASAVRPHAWWALAWVACLLGMGTKEVMVSAPLIVVLYDRLFVATSWGEVWQRRKFFHLALAGTWLLLAGLVLGTGGRGGAEGFSLGGDGMDYWATQFRAVVKYLALGAWPQPLVLDYGVEWARGFGAIAPYAVAVMILLAATGVALWRGHPLAWTGAWFFAVLAPTSLMPGGRQTMVEHRMYLPLAAVFAIVVLVGYVRVGRRVVWLAAVVAGGFGALTVARNLDYRSTLALWADTVAKRPDNRWARDNLGNALLDAGRPSEALAQYEAALALAPDDAVHHYNAGNALVRLGREADAIARFAEAVRLASGYLPARTNLGNALCRAGRFAEAIEHYAFVAGAEPRRAENHANLADAFFRAGRSEEAVAELREATRLEPGNAEFAYGLGCVLLQTGRAAEAIPEFERAVRAESRHAEAQNNLGSAFAQLGRPDDALRHVRESVRLNPANPEAHNNLGAIYLHLGRREEAAAEFAEALRLAPEHAMARQNLARLGRPSL